MSGGYDVNWLEGPHDSLECSICALVARDAVVTPKCGHLFCQSCIQRALQNRKECPQDRTPLLSSELLEDMRARRAINSLKCRCNNTEEGCLWTGELSHFEEHSYKCNFIPATGSHRVQTVKDIRNILKEMDVVEDTAPTNEPEAIALALSNLQAADPSGAAANTLKKLISNCASSHAGTVNLALAALSAVEAQLDSGPPLDKQGWMVKKGGARGGRRNWNRRWFTLVGGRLSYYQDDTQQGTAKLLLNMSSCRLEDTKSSQAHSFSVVDTEGFVFQLAAENASEKQEWLDALRACEGGAVEEGAAAGGASGGGARRPRQSVFMRTKKHISSKAATSKVGKKIIRRVMGSEGTRLLESMLLFVSRNSGQEVATNLEESILKLAVKGGLLAQGEQISLEAVRPISQPAMHFCQEFIRMSDENVTFLDFGGLRDSFDFIQTLLTDVLRPHLTDNSMQRMKDVFDYFSSETNLRAVLRSPDYVAERTAMVSSLLVLLGEGISVA